MSTWNWKRGLLGAGFVLGAGCNLGDLVDEEAFLDKFKGIEVPQAGIDQVTKKIGEAGGQAVTMDGAVNIPEGALSEDVDITVEQADPEVIVAPLPSVLKPVSAPVSFKPDGTKFDEPVTLTLFHDKSAAEPEQPVVVWLENEKDPNWKTVKSEDTYTDGDKTHVVTDHFSVYAVVDCQATGPLAHLCQDLLDGKITLSDVLAKAPPLEDTWGHVVDPGEDEPAPTAYDCRRCFDIAQKCAQDPRQDICEDAKEPCTKLAPSCADELSCDQLRIACDHDQPAACDEFDRRCGGTALPRCEQLALDCERGNRGACDALARECGGQADCGALYDKCHAGDEASCTQYEQAGCGLGGGPDECAEAEQACLAGNRDACAFYEGFCGGPAPSDCDIAHTNCEVYADQEACYYYDTHCAGAIDEDCQRASVMCENGDAHACDLYQFYCTGTEPNVDECTAANDACYVGNQDACYFHETNCSGTEPSCDKLYYDCHELSNREACYAYDQQCGGGGEPDCSYHYDQCYGPAASIEDCYAYDQCMGYDADPNCYYERVCYPAGCEGDVCWPEECYAQYRCDEPPPNCDQLYVDCQNGNQEACYGYDMQCTGSGGGDGGVAPPPPPAECEQLWASCDAGDAASCDEAHALGCPPPGGEPADAGVPSQF